MNTNPILYTATTKGSSENLFREQSALLTDEELIAFSLEIIAYYIKHNGYGDLLPCIAVYGEGRPLVRVWEHKGASDVVWEVDFLKTPFVVKRHYHF